MVNARLVKPVFDSNSRMHLHKFHHLRLANDNFAEEKMEEYAREPCPWRIIDDCGGAFSMGLIGRSVFSENVLSIKLNTNSLTCFFFPGGGFFNMLGGAYNAPAGYQRRLMGGIIRVKERWVVL